MLEQASLLKAADVIQFGAFEQDPDGFTGLQLADSKVILWWSGDIPASFQPTIKQARAIAPVEIRNAAYSEKQLNAAADRIGAAVGQPAGGPAHTVLVSATGSGVQVLTAPGSRISGLRTPDVGVPVQFKESPPAEMASRCNDASPWQGGVGYRNSSRTITGAPCVDNSSETHTCSAAYGVKNSAGTTYLLTARHCGMVGDVMKDTTGETIGTAAVGNKSQDVMLIRATIRPYVWDGGSTSASLRAVTNYGNAPVGTSLCASGARTGTTCNYTVTEWRARFLNWKDFDNTTVTTTDLTLAKKSCSPGNTIDSGDSGGAVFNYNSDRTISARGIANAKVDTDADGCIDSMYLMDWGRMNQASGFETITPVYP
ncbi:S1 family peptidase [Nonomuraea aurantiaca]|uniref:S1 family peptidase n=1 Tax=Nonomuraea aurantiaca TaxID=2878562 RepID=UPI001CD9C528|nr:S1 family peptidase [Nonomuraea aurantiaca]MCA2229426.1 S1 family peptidase [Nonomuraea aurantiaca]